jgi:hypothetical protein
MKPKMYSSKSNSQLHDHILDGTFATYEGLQVAKKEFSKQEYTALLEKIILRLRERVVDFRVKEGLMDTYKRALSIFFACLFAWMQINGDDLDMRRSSRTRSTARGSRSVRSQRNGRRRLEEV